MLRFIIERMRYDGACLNALERWHETVDAECPALEAVLRTGGKGGGPDNDAFDIPRLIGVEVRDSQTVKEAAQTEKGK